MRILGIMPIRNEAHRYLEANLAWHKDILDGLAVYDDQSDDDSALYCWDAGAKVKTRPDSVHSFLDHEGLFRQACWEWMEEALKPEEGDWILALDADEFLVSIDGDVRRQLIEVAATALGEGVYIPIPEVFEVKDGVPYIRTDGFWRDLGAPRYFRYLSDGKFNEVPMGCGSFPNYVQSFSRLNRGLRLLHLGYVTAQDRTAKYQRYSGVEGHNPVHIESILQRPRVERWPYAAPEL